MSIYDASKEVPAGKCPTLIVVAGKDYGSGVQP
jgi:aconitase A